MSRPRNPYPTPRCHKGRAVVDVYDGGERRTVTLGAWGSPEAEQEFARLMAERRVSDRLPIHNSSVTVNEVLLGFLRWAESYYRTQDGTPTHEIVELRLSARPVRELYQIRAPPPHAPHQYPPRTGATPGSPRWRGRLASGGCGRERDRRERVR